MFIRCCALAAIMWLSPMGGVVYGQENSPSLSIQAAIGPGKARTSSQEHRNDGGGLTLDAIAAVRFVPLHSGAVLVGVSANTQGTIARTADCIPAPDGECIPWYPGFGALSLLAGWASPGDRVRILTGPSRVTADSTVLGWQGRLDVSTRRVWGLSAIVSGRAMHIPDYEGETYQTFSLGVGLRLSAF